MDPRLRNAAKRLGLRRPSSWRRELRARRDPVRRRDRLDNEHFALLLAFTLETDSNCIDVGANRGAVLREMVRCAPEGTHHAFEPLPHLANALEHEFPQATVHQVALGESDRVATFSHVADADTLSGLSDRNLAGSHQITHLQVPVRRLDDVVPAEYRPSLLKLDVEGAELLVLRGAQRLLSEHRPLIWFEHGHGGSGFFGYTPQDMWDLLCQDHGYSVFDADGHGPLSRSDFFEGTGASMWTYLARP